MSRGVGNECPCWVAVISYNMAATQAEKQQQNDVNSEKVQPEQHLNLRNTLLQNGTEKSGVRGGSAGNVVVTKTKASSSTSAKNQNLGNAEMSQYRQDGGVAGSCPTPQSMNEQNMNTGGSGGGGGGGSSGGLDSDLNQNTDVSHTYPPTVSETGSGGDPAVSGAAPMHGPGGGYGFPFAGSRGVPGPGYPPHGAPPNAPPDQHPGQQPNNSADSGIIQGFSQFGPQGIPRHGFSGSKQPMIGPRPGSAPPPPFHQQQRFMSGQSISQPTGPTPTLNQLLQSSNPMHRYQNSYGHTDYSQGWSSQKPLSAYNPQGLGVQPSGPVPPYRNQAVVSICSLIVLSAFFALYYFTMLNKYFLFIYFFVVICFFLLTKYDPYKTTTTFCTGLSSVKRMNAFLYVLKK